MAHQSSGRVRQNPANLAKFTGIGHRAPPTTTNNVATKTPTITRTQAREVWNIYLELHDGDWQAAMGELVTILFDNGMLTDGRRAG